MGSTDGYTLDRSSGQAIWFLGTLMVIKAGAEETGGGFTLIEQVAPAGFAPPLHLHRDEDEAFYVLEGEITVTCGSKRWSAKPGSFCMLPRGIVHGFSVSGESSARILQLTLPAGFERFALEAGEPASTLEIPPPGRPDIPKLLQAAAKYGLEISGPEPEP
jgi:quercetin dioxygenase-like cupin family protein